MLKSDEPIYQTQYGPIELQWNTTVQTSDVANFTWMAGTMPLLGDIHAETVTTDDQVSVECL